MTDFAGRRILVTGAGGGIGGATARRLAERGAVVLASDRTAANVAGLVNEIGAQAVPFDLTSEDEVRDALTGLDLDGVVNCGGWGGEIATPQDTDIAAFDQAVAINTRGALLVIKYAARSMIAAGRGGAIVNVSSQAALVALPGHVSYAASKAGLDAITRVSALELGPHGIRVNSVNPTAVMTDMSVEYWSRPEIRDPYLAQMPLGRYATEDEIAGPILFLLSEAAAMVTGVVLPVDGGYTCR